MTTGASIGISNCCKASYYVEGGETHYYVCNQCGKPCDVISLLMPEN